jgi:hypothetical protein
MEKGVKRPAPLHQLNEAVTAAASFAILRSTDRCKEPTRLRVGPALCLLPVGLSPVALQELTQYPDSFVDNIHQYLGPLCVQANNLLVCLIASAPLIGKIVGT